MLEDFRLKVFMAVRSEHSFTKAARSLGISQPAVSQNIAELEKELGVELFTRSRGEVTLTPAGISFEEYASRILHWYSAAGRVFGPDGKLSSKKPVRISADSLVADSILPTVMPRLLSVNPSLSVKVVPDERGNRHDIRMWCRIHSEELSIEDSAAFACTIEASAITYNPSLAKVDDIHRLPGESRFVVWSPYSSHLPSDVGAMTVVETYSSTSVCSLVSTSPLYVGLVSRITALASRLPVMPVNLHFLKMDVMVAAADSSDPVCKLLKDVLREDL